MQIEKQNQSNDTRIQNYVAKNKTLLIYPASPQRTITDDRILSELKNNFLNAKLKLKEFHALF